MIVRLFKVIIHVQNMDDQVAFYRDLLDLPVATPKDCDSYKNEEWVVFNTGKQSQLALHRVAQSRNEYANTRICFEVEDLQNYRALLSLKGVNIEEIFSPAPGVEILSAMDPEGNLFSLESHS